ncbi:MAG: hypothetical protein EXS55_01945 [Candidatus Magasanikbacteria bacterium]|nr:hypothetical protein [Candidatus Magasanikbacteria bacterium]
MYLLQALLERLSTVGPVLGMPSYLPPPQPRKDATTHLDAMRQFPFLEPTELDIPAPPSSPSAAPTIVILVPDGVDRVVATSRWTPDDVARRDAFDRDGLFVFHPTFRPSRRGPSTARVAS